MPINFYVIQNLMMLTCFDKVTCKQIYGESNRKIFAILIMNVPIIMIYSKQKLVQHILETAQLQLLAILCVSS
jgi:hypothetical protein